MNLKEKSCRNLMPLQQHANRPRGNLQQPVSTLKDTTKQPQPQTEGSVKQQPRNIVKDATAAADKVRNETAAAAKRKKSDREDILRSQNNEKKSWPSSMIAEKSRKKTKNN